MVKTELNISVLFIGECQIHSEKSTYTEQSGHDLQLARVLRIYYIHDPKSEVCPYGNIQLSTRLFIPTRMDDYYGKTCETFSKTMQRVITWLNLTREFILLLIKWPLTLFILMHYPIHRGSYMSAFVLLDLLNKLEKRDKMGGLPSILSLFATSLINSIIKEHEC